MAESVDQKKPREKKMKTKSKNKLSLKLIEDLGGTKDDLQLLEDVDDDEDMEDIEFVLSDDEPSKEEISRLITRLGLDLHRPDFSKEPKTKRKKLVKADVSNEDDLEEKNKETKKCSADPDTVVDKKKRKEKNKFKTEEGKNVEDWDRVIKEDGAKKKKQDKLKVQHNEVSSTTASIEEELRKHITTSPHRSQLLVKPEDAWIDHQERLSTTETVSKALAQQCEQFAAKLFDNEVMLYNTQQEKQLKSKYHFMKKVLASGTLTDKLATLMDLFVRSPVHNMTALETMVSMVNKKGKREAILATNALKNALLCDTSAVPDDRKLIAFGERPFATLWHTCSGNKDGVDRKLLVWYVEDLLKRKYAEFVKALDLMSFDTLLASREKAISIIHSLLSSKPEKEEILLPMLVNKLGDHKMASKASYLLIKLVEQHPNMKVVIVSEVERLIYRPNIPQRAQYYAVCFLVQIKLHKSDQRLASQLIKMYFSLFKVYVSKGDIDNKMMSALLTGVNRAYPFAKMQQDLMSEQMQTLFKLVHQVNFSTSIQALMLLHQVVDPSKNDADRFFMALFRKMMDPELATSAKLPQFLNLIYKSLKTDIMEKRVKAILKRLLQRGVHLGPNFLCGALIVVSEILRLRPNLLTLKQIGKFADSDSVSNPFDNGEDDNEEERFVDLPVPPEFLEQNDDQGIAEQAAEIAEQDKGDKIQTGGSSSWVHKINLTGKSELDGYSPYQRNPLHCHAQNECLWELLPLRHHHHPSVSLFASAILEGKPISYDGDPLEDFNLIRFLDRFVFKNPKKKLSGEVHQETVGAAAARKKAAENVPVISAEFVSMSEDAVPEHEKYLYLYQTKVAEKRKKIEEEREDSDASVSDTEFDAFLDKSEKKMDPDYLGDFILSDEEVKEKKKGKKRQVSEDELSDDDMEFDDDLRDDALAAEFAKEMEAAYQGDDDHDDNEAEYNDRDEDEFEDADSDGEEVDFEEEDLEEVDEDDDISGDELKAMMSGAQKRKKDNKNSGPPKKKAKSKRNAESRDSLFASADDFAELLEENAESATSLSGTAHDVSNKDKASAKQIAWEMDRDRKLSGKDWKHNKHKRGKGKFASKGRPYGQGGKGSGQRGEGKSHGQGNKGSGHRGEGKSHGQGSKGSGHRGEGKSHGQGNKGIGQRGEGKPYGQGSKGSGHRGEGRKKVPFRSSWKKKGGKPFKKRK